MNTNMDLTQDSPTAELIDLSDIPPVLSPHRPEDEPAAAGSSFEDEELTEGVAMDHTVTNPVTSDTIVPAGQQGHKMLRKPARRSGQESFFMIEKIIGHRHKHDREEVLIKWKNYDVTHNTWEPVSNLTKNSLGLLEIYKTIQAQGLDDTGPIRMGNEGASSEILLETKLEVSDQQPMDSATELPPNVEVTGFDDPTKEFDTIMGMTERGDQLFFLIAFRVNGQDLSYELIPARVANLKIPIQVIDYYEARLCYNAQ